MRCSKSSLERRLFNSFCSRQRS